MYVQKTALPWCQPKKSCPCKRCGIGLLTKTTFPQKTSLQTTRLKVRNLEHHTLSFLVHALVAPKPATRVPLRRCLATACLFQTQPDVRPFGVTRLPARHLLQIRRGAVLPGITRCSKTTLSTAWVCCLAMRRNKTVLPMQQSVLLQATVCPTTLKQQQSFGSIRASSRESRR